MEMKRQPISEAELEEIRDARKANQNKKTDRRLQVLEMHAEGKSQTEILSVSNPRVTDWSLP